MCLLCPFSDGAQVDDILFKVPRRIFDDSQVFQHILLRASRDQPVHLVSVAIAEFKHLLRYLLPRLASKFDYRSQHSLLACRRGLEAHTVASLTSVLKLTTLLEFPAVRAAAIADLGSRLDDHRHRLALARAYGISAWKISALRWFITREQDMTPEDVRLLGTDWAFEVSTLRQAWGPGSGNAHSILPDEKIQGAFGL
jgi:hypothetical protein